MTHITLGDGPFNFIVAEEAFPESLKKLYFIT